MANTGNLSIHGASSYGTVRQDHSYETDNGYAVLPVAGRTSAWKRVRLHGGIGFRRVKWSASRAGVPPIIPTPTDTANDYILSSTITPSMPSPNPNEAGYNWSVEGEYLYVQRTPRAPQTNALPTGGYPFPIGINDSLAVQMTLPVAQTFVNAGNPVYSIADLTIVRLGSQVNQESDKFVWPFTTLAPAFTSSNLIGA